MASKKNKILLIHNVISPHVLPVFSELAKLVDLRVLFCASSEGNRSWKEKPKGFSYTVLANKAIELKGKDLFTLFINRDLVAQLSKSKPDLVIISGWDLPSYWLTALYCVWKHIPYLLWSGSTLYEPSWRRTVAQPLVKLMIGGASGFLAYGLRARDYLISLGATPEKIHIAYNGVAINHFAKLTQSQSELVKQYQKQYQLKNKKIILYYGQLIERKRPTLLIEAFKKLQKQIDNMFLVIIGSGSMKEELEELIQKKHISDVLILDNPGDDIMPIWYKLANCLVLPSHEEVWGLVVNQAMAAGLPVVVSDHVGSSVDLVVNNHTGFTFKDNDLDDLVEKLAYLFSHEQERKQMGKLASSRVQKTSPEKVAEQILHAINSTINKTKDNMVSVVELPTINDDGFLSFIQSPTVPFDINRVYYIYQTLPELARGFHAHKQTQQMMICLQGKVRLVLDDGINRRDVVLNQASQGILIDKMVWHEMHDLSPDTILLVLASHKYQPDDYIREYSAFIKNLQLLQDENK